LRAWLETVLAVPARDFPDFPAALSLLPLLHPDEVRTALEARSAALEPRLRELEAPVPGLPRLFLVESEYMAAVLRAELEWLRTLSADLRAGRLTWSAAWLRRIARQWAQRSGSADAPKVKQRRRAKRSGKR
jgi:hypothetical protein